ncbi:MAG: ferredoxin family protein, partial [Pirellulales bacterium]
MAKRVTVVLSQGQSANPAKRGLEEMLVAELLGTPGVEITVVPHLYDLKPDGSGMLCLQGITGDMIVLSWLYPRAAHWILARNQVQGAVGTTLLRTADDEDFDEDEDSDIEAVADEESQTVEANPSPTPSRSIYCLDLRAYDDAKVYTDEIRRIVQEASVQTVSLMPSLGSVSPAKNGNGQLSTNGATNGKSSTNGATANGSTTNGQSSGVTHNEPIVIKEDASRRWYPVIDFGRCTNCMECIDFCLFGVYGVDAGENILVEQPDNCRKGCPACSRVCPENAIIFPQHKTPAIAGSPVASNEGFKIDLSKLFGAPNAMEVAAMERDRELVADGRDAVGMSVGIPKRQADQEAGPRDELDDLMDKLDDL